MGKNRISDGKSIMIAIPAGGCSSGGQAVANTTTVTPGIPILVGNDMVGVPEGTYGAGTVGNVTLYLSGVYGNQTLKALDVPVQGDKLYLDSGNSYLTTTAGGNVFAGWCYETPVAGTNIVSLLLKL